MDMFTKIILKLALKVLAKAGGQAKIDDIYLVRMSEEFHDWVYSDGYKIFKGKQDSIKSFKRALAESHYRHTYLE